MSAAASAVTQPAILTRAQWGADESLRNGFAGYGETIKAGFVHHTTGASDYTSAEVPGMIRAIYAYHTQTLGWSDIGYNFLVDRFGRLHEGRWGGMDQPVVGAHTGGFNTNTVGVTALGDHETSPVPTTVMTGFGQLLGWRLGLHGADPHGRVTLTSGGGDSNRYPAGQAVEFNVISGHRDASYTLCPGQHLYPRLPEIRSEAAAFIGRPGPLRAVTPARVLDTRTGLGAPAGVVAAGSSRSLQVTGRGGVPASGVGTVVLNLTAVKPSKGGYLTVYPTGRTRPTTSNLNYPAGRPAVANLVHVAVGGGGAVTIYAGNADVHVVADVYGWTSNGGASRWRPTVFSTPGRRSHSALARSAPCRSPAGALVNEARSYQAGGTAGLPVAGGPDAPTAVVLNVTAVHAAATTGGYFTPYPADIPTRPLTSDLNFKGTQIVPNLVVVKLSPDSRFTLASAAPDATHAVIDVLGYYTR
jgi:hypothetical protein